MQSPHALSCCPTVMSCAGMPMFLWRHRAWSRCHFTSESRAVWCWWVVLGYRSSAVPCNECIRVAPGRNTMIARCGGLMASPGRTWSCSQLMLQACM